MIASINSPVRIFTPSDSALGEYGTVLWLDAQTDLSAVAQAGDRGQRVAGKLLDFPQQPRPTQAEQLPRHAVDLVASPDGEVTAPGSLSNGASGEGAPLGSGLMAFLIQEEKDDWVRVAMCEEEGLIAIGTVSGGISVYKYI